MSLRLLREHYVKVNGVYKSKKSFDLASDIDTNVYRPSRWHVYTCSVCGKFHISKIENKRKR